MTLLATFSLMNGLIMAMSMLNSLTIKISLLTEILSLDKISSPRCVYNVTLSHPEWKGNVEEGSEIPAILVANGSHLKSSTVQYF